MIVGHRFEMPPERLEQRHRAKHLAWLSIALLVSAAALLWFALGQSEAMKTAWVTDILSLIPPIALLVAMRFELREPSERFPYGYFRARSVSFLVTSAVLSIIGLWLLFDSVMKLLHEERPPIGIMVLFGHRFWAGWAMIVALAYSMVVGIIIGKLKQPVARKLTDKALEAESKMNRAEWMSEGAAIVGITLVAFGHWWGDAAAAALISIDIVFEGWENVRQVIGDLMDESPTVLGERKLEELPRRVKEAAERLEWVDRAAVRLREQGHVLSGDVFVVPRDGTNLVGEIERASTELRKIDWRLYSLTIMPVSRLDAEAPPRG